MKKLKKPKYKVGDILRRRWNNEDIVRIKSIERNSEGYYYVMESKLYNRDYQYTVSLFDRDNPEFVKK